MIKSVIFDIGEVLVDFDWDEYIHSLFTDAETIRRIERAVWESRLWIEFDRGVLPDEEIIRKMTECDPELAEEIRLSMKDVSSTVRCRDTALPWIRSLKARGLQVLYLSNYSCRLRTQNREALCFLKEMDGGLFSYEVHLLKPDPAIYLTLCERYKISPEETVFLDDREDNVAGAKECGMQAIRYTTQEETEQALIKLLDFSAGSNCRTVL